MLLRRLFRWKYPKLVLLAISVGLAYLLFSRVSLEVPLGTFGSYVGSFIAGLLFSFGFTTPFAIGYFVSVSPDSLFIAALLGGLGAMLSDLLIFSFVRFSFMDEFRKLRSGKIASLVGRRLSIPLSDKVKHYLLYVVAGMIIASPLPDEFGVSLLSGVSHIRRVPFMLVSFVCNTLGILFFLYLGKA